MSNRSLGRKLESIPKGIIYLLLILCTSLPLFLEVRVPNTPREQAKDFYATLMGIPEGSSILLASDWTGSTRGESKAQFTAILRILMRRNIKFALYSVGDVQAPEVAKDVILEVNAERKKKGEREYQRWNDWVMLGFFPDGPTALQGFAKAFRASVSSRKDASTTGEKLPVFESPVLKDIKRIEDFKLLLLITASKTSDYTVERCFGRVPLAFAVTGVMVPETQVYYNSKQIKGFCGALAGAYDLETLMEYGINYPDPEKAVVKSDKLGTIDGFPGANNAGAATRYTSTLHVAVLLMVIFVVIGNVGMFLNKKGDR